MFARMELETFPALAATNDRNFIPNVRPETEDVDTAMPAPLRILVVDDNADLVRVLGSFLELRGHDVITATSGESALKLANEHRPEIAIVDIGMPGMSGVDVARKIRAKPWGKNVFLIAATGRNGEQDQKRTEAAGFDLHLTKPVSMFKLEGSLLFARNGAG